MSTNVVDLVGVLTGAVRTVSIGAVLNYLHSTAVTFTLFTTLLLQEIALCVNSMTYTYIVHVYVHASEYTYMYVD